MDKYRVHLVAINKFLFTFFVLQSIFVKFYEISYRSFFQDELYSVSAALTPTYNSFINDWVLYDSNPPLYYFFLRFWLQFFPATEFWIRLPSVLFVLAAIFCFVRGIRKRFENQEWFYLLFLTGTCYGFLFFAQEARAYGLLFFFTCFQFLYFIDLIKINERKKLPGKLLLFTVFSVLSSYTHYTGIVFSTVLFCALILVHRKDFWVFKRLLISILFSIASGFLWINNFLFFFHLDKSSIIHQKLSILKNIIPMLFFGYSTVGKLFSMLALILFCVCIILFLKKQSLFSKNKKYILHIGIISFVIILLSPFIPYFFSYRHYLVFIPVLLLSIAFLSSTFVKISNWQKTLLLLTGIVIIFFQGATHYKSKRDEWRQAVDYVVKESDSKNIKVIVIGEPWEKTPKEYLLNNQGDLNLSIRRKSYYKYYFDRISKNHTVDLIVLRANEHLIEKYIDDYLKTGKQIFIVSYTGGFSKDIKGLKTQHPFIKKEFYNQVVYQYYVKEK